jgi:hypothetical protein
MAPCLIKRATQQAVVRENAEAPEVSHVRRIPSSRLAHWAAVRSIKQEYREYGKMKEADYGSRICGAHGRIRSVAGICASLVDPGR